jgi:enoyl-CoA hydratase/carnithine racemase
MSGEIQFEQHSAVAQVTVSHAARFNAMSRAMWRELRSAFEQIQASPDLRCVLVRGEGANFCSGGDISEYTAFRFQAESLQDFHENEVWGALQAMLNCDVPMVAQIEGNCMGAGLELASCCDIRLACASARFGAPIARLGFPMAPREAALVAREVGLTTARQILLEAAVFSAPEMMARGYLSRVMPDDKVAAEATATVQRIVALAPQAARLNKQALRSLNRPLALDGIAPVATQSVAYKPDAAYAYADSAEHREGISAFLAKRPPVF